MNRDGDEPGQPPEGEARPAPVDEATAADNVIPFPGARVRAAPPTEPSSAAPTDLGAGPDGGASGASEGDDEPGMTLDAFERAVRSAVRERLGDGQPQGADELAAQVFSALTGKDGPSALAEVRQRLSEPAGGARSEDAPAADVIDLSAVREARERANLEAARQIGGALKETFNQFLAGLARRPGAGDELTIDASFLKQHGPSLIGNLFQGLAAALLQQARPAGQQPAAAAPEPSQAAAPTPPAQAATPSEPDAPPGAAPASDAPPPRQVQIKLDLGSLLTSLFRRREPPSEGPPPERD